MKTLLEEFFNISRRYGSTFLPGAVKTCLFGVEMRSLIAALVMLCTWPVFGLINDQQFPVGPVPSVTPGQLCNHPSSYRYPEKIAYCERDVSPEVKRAVIKIYDDRFGYKIENMDRHDFKIDHYIPLCMGGSNDSSNLWPQHKSVYEITDPLEPALCAKMAEGRLKQADAIKMVKDAKADLSKVEDILIYVEGL